MTFSYRPTLLLTALLLLLGQISAFSSLLQQQKFMRSYVCVMTQPNTEYTSPTNPSFLDHNSYVSSSYVRFIEQTGAVAVIVPWDLPWAEMTAVLGQCNGLLLPGGAASLLNRNTPTTYMIRIGRIITWAAQQNLSGRFFSIWAECLGFEELFLA
jgi:hypothetical protein